MAVANDSGQLALGSIVTMDKPKSRNSPLHCGHWIVGGQLLVDSLQTGVGGT